MMCRLERRDDVVDSLEVVELDLLDFVEIDVARELLRAELVDDLVGVERCVGRERLERPAQLARVEAPRKPKHLGEVDRFERARRRARPRPMCS